MAEITTRPYPGACPFQRADGDLFFGRPHETSALADLWQTNKLTIAYGPAASGKSSLLQAGILPSIPDKRFDVLPPGRVSYGATFPFAGLPEHNPYTLALLRSWAPGESPSRLIGLTIAEYIRRRARRRGAIILASVDQAEELITDASPRWIYRQQFLRELSLHNRFCGAGGREEFSLQILKGFAIASGHGNRGDHHTMSLVVKLDLRHHPQIGNRFQYAGELRDFA